MTLGAILIFIQYGSAPSVVVDVVMRVWVLVKMSGVG